MFLYEYDQQEQIGAPIFSEFSQKKREKKPCLDLNTREVKWKGCV